MFEVLATVNNDLRLLIQYEVDRNNYSLKTLAIAKSMEDFVTTICYERVNATPYFSSHIKCKKAALLHVLEMPIYLDRVQVS